MDYILVASGHQGLAENSPDYISSYIIDPSSLDETKKTRTKKAIRWLLSKTPQSINEIAEHYGISPQLVEGLIKELTSAKVVVRAAEDSSRYYSNLKKN